MTETQTRRIRYNGVAQRINGVDVPRGTFAMFVNDFCIGWSVSRSVAGRWAVS